MQSNPQHANPSFALPDHALGISAAARPTAVSVNLAGSNWRTEDCLYE